MTTLGRIMFDGDPVVRGGSGVEFAVVVGRLVRGEGILIITASQGAHNNVASIVGTRRANRR